MRTLGFIVALGIAALLQAQSAGDGHTVAERLGYPADARLLILHADDLGAAHSIDAATFDALEHGAISSASVMTPAPWAAEVAAYARAHPAADIGVHLTITSEWAAYRWSCVAPSDSVPSLLDRDGMFYRQDADVARAARPSEVQRELRAQIARAVALGIHPTHIDSHMLALFTTPALFDAYVKVARDERLPMLVSRKGLAAPVHRLERRDLVINDVIAIPPDVHPDAWRAFYVAAIARLKPGISEIIVHLGHDDAELRAVTAHHEAYGAAWRQRDYDVVMSPQFQRALREHHVVLVTWKQVAHASAQVP